MQNILIVVDMQNDFIDGALGTAEAVQIVDKVKDKIQSFDGKVIFTRDTHYRDYLTTQEGQHLPVEHCIKDTEGWQIRPELALLRKPQVIDKPTFGSLELGELLKAENECESIESVTLVGLCTDICVISNAMIIKAALPETAVKVDAACCAGVSPESHNTALQAMKMCQIQIENEV